MQSFSPRIWTRVTVSISHDDNHYIPFFYWMTLITNITNIYEFKFILKKKLLLLVK